MALERVSYCVNAAAIRYPDPSDSIVDDSPSPRQTRVRLWAFTANPRSVWSDVPDRQICVDDIGAIAHQLQAKLLCSFRPRRQSDTIIGEQSKQFPPHEIDVVVFRCGDQMYFKPVRHCALPLCRSAIRIKPRLFQSSRCCAQFGRQNIICTRKHFHSRQEASRRQLSSNTIAFRCVRIAGVKWTWLLRVDVAKSHIP
jgi:hypothetical protein